MKEYNIALLAGDGTGKEVTDEAVKVFKSRIKNPCTNKHENNEFKVNKLKSLKFVKTIVANGSCNGYNFSIVELN